MTSNQVVQVANSDQSVRRRSRRNLGVITAALVVIVAVGCTSEAEPINREAATYRGTRVTVINNSSATVQVRQSEPTAYDYDFSWEGFEPLPPGERREYRTDGGYFDGGTVQLFMTWDPLPATAQVNFLQFGAFNKVAANKMYHRVYVAEPGSDWWQVAPFGTREFTEPEGWYGETVNRYLNHRIRLARQGWDTYFYNWDFIIET